MGWLLGQKGRAAVKAPLPDSGRDDDVLHTIQKAASAGQAVARRSTFSPAQALARGNVAFGVVLILLSAFAVLFALVKSQKSAATDIAITMKVQRQRHPWLQRLMSVISWPGFPPQSRIIPPVLSALLWAIGLRLEAIFQFAAWGTTGISFCVKKLMRRPRPNHPEIRVAIANIGGTSFPSGHVLGYVGVYGFLTFLINTLLRPTWLRRAISAVLLTFISLVGASRVYLGHHWFTDVLASYLLGLSYLIGLTALYRKVKAWTQSNGAARP